MLDFENRCEPAPLRRREVRRLARTGSPATCDEGKTGSFLEGSDLNEDVTASKLLSNDYIIATINASAAHGTCFLIVCKLTFPPAAFYKFNPLALHNSAFLFIFSRLLHVLRLCHGR